jgi:UDP-N-acetylglucosamine 2-epimerase (non-hydrolysing)
MGHSVGKPTDPDVNALAMSRPGGQETATSPTGLPVNRGKIMGERVNLPNGGSRYKVLVLFGTRPEVIKLAPVIRELESAAPMLQAVNVTSGQHTDLLYPFIRFFGVRVHHDLQIMQPGQTLNEVCGRLLLSLDPVLSREAPDLILVQGDTATALAGAWAGFQRGIPVGHVEAGLRSGDPLNPWPEEMNRRLISRVATYHFAATAGNRDYLLSEGVPADRIVVTGNPVVDSLQQILRQSAVSPAVADLLRATDGCRRLVVTAHRRESFGAAQAAHFRTLRAFVDRHRDVVMLFPVHPNPAVNGPAHALLSGHPRIRLLPAMGYLDFVRLLQHAWLIVSDSGGVQEEVPTLGKPLLILRETTERPEVVDAGFARLVGGPPDLLASALEDAGRHLSGQRDVPRAENPFGSGDSAARIVRGIRAFLGVSHILPRAA